MLVAIKEIINPDVMIDMDLAKKELTLKETGTDSKISKLLITNMPTNAIAFTLDYQPGGEDNRWFQQLSPYVNIRNSKGVNKGCDLIILWCEAGSYTALIFDLKSNKPKKEATQKQLDNSELYLKYLLNMITLHYKISTDNVIIKKAIVATDNRVICKTAAYPRNSRPTRVGNYHVEQVIPKPHRVGYIALQQLAR